MKSKTTKWQQQDAEGYQKLTRSKEPLTEFFRRSPLSETELETDRDKSPARKSVVK